MGVARPATLTSFRATQTVYKATSLKMCSSRRRLTNTCTQVRTSEKLAARSSSLSATRPHLLAVPVEVREEWVNEKGLRLLGLRGNFVNVILLGHGTVDSRPRSSAPCLLHGMCPSHSPSGPCVAWWGPSVLSPSSSCCSRGVSLTTSCLDESPEPESHFLSVLLASSLPGESHLSSCSSVVSATAARPGAWGLQALRGFCLA
jgi:hypothetical protein